MLQREGRLIDFCEEELAGFSDAQNGAAARAATLWQRWPEPVVNMLNRGEMVEASVDTQNRPLMDG